MRNMKDGSFANDKGQMLKRLFLFGCLFFIILSLSGCKSTDFIQINMLYNYIEYDGTVYRRMIDVDPPEPWEYSDLNGISPVYIVDTSMNIRRDRSYSATEIVKDSKNRYLDSDGRILYLFFDSANFVIDDSVEPILQDR